MINYGYFRHRFDATKDPKIQNLIDDLGMAGVGYYFTLLELYGDAYNASGRENLCVKIHQRILADTWRKRVDSCDKVLTKLQLSGLLVYTKSQQTYSIDIPNFLKYFGSYEKKNAKEKKRKENKRNKKIYIKKNTYTPDDLMQLWNEIMPPKFEFCRGLYSETALKNFQVTSQYVESLDDWKNIFLKCKEIPNLNGDNNLKFKATLNWLVDFNKLEPVLNGAFGAREKTGMQLLAEKWGLNEQV